MKVATRNPRCHVRIISLEYGEILAETVRPALKRVSVHRRMGTAAGSFQLLLLPRRTNTPGIPLDWRDVLAPMDYVEISIEIAPRLPTVIMRGFVDTVSEQGQIGERGASRTVQVTGRDFGKLLLITKLYYLDGVQQVVIFEKWRQAFLSLFAWNGGKPPPPEHPPLPRNVNTNAPLYSPQDLLQGIFDAFYLPQQDLILQQYPTVPPIRFFPVTNALNNTNERELSTIAPDALSLNWTPFTDVWMLLKQYQHQPWRELYVTDMEEGPRLIYRPSPWMDVNGQFVFPDMEGGHMGTMPTHQVSEGDIAEYSLSHSDEYAKNFFFTYTDEFGALAQMVKTVGPHEGIVSDPLKGNPYLVGYQATDRAKEKRADYNVMGFRLHEVRTPYLDFDHRTGEEQIGVRLKAVREQGLQENLKLARAYDHGGVLEFGAFVLKGDERIGVGHYVEIADAALLRLGTGARYYVEGVSHLFQQGSVEGDGVFLTTAEVSRGRGHMMRKGLVSR